MEIKMTRISYGLQIREALDALVATGEVRSWSFGVEPAPRGIRYTVTLGNGTPRKFAPGEIADFLNAKGFAIFVGKAPVACAVCGVRLTADEERSLRADVDFVEHGDRGHLIRVER